MPDCLFKRVCVFLSGSLLLVTPLVVAKDIPNIAAASSLQFALKEVQTDFTSETGLSLRISYGSSGNFKRQIEQGAPFELFLSANEAYVAALHQQEQTLDAGKIYALGRIAIFAPQGSPLPVDANLEGLRELLEQGRLQRFAIANPNHAPYGKAAQQALMTVGLWDSIKPRLVLGENASQAAQFATSGSSQGGILPYSLALAPAISQQGTSRPLPAGWHRPINHRMVLMKRAGDTAKRFYQYLQTSAAQKIFLQYGFDSPG